MLIHDGNVRNSNYEKELFPRIKDINENFKVDPSKYQESLYNFGQEFLQEFINTARRFPSSLSILWNANILQL